MITITAKFLGGMSRDIGVNRATAEFPVGTPLPVLEEWLRSLGANPDAADLIFTLDGVGLRQLPPEYRLVADCTVAIFPVISGGVGSKGDLSN